jgi:hypothetical protein
MQGIDLYEKDVTPYETTGYDGTSFNLDRHVFIGLQRTIHGGAYLIYGPCYGSG